MKRVKRIARIGWRQESRRTERGEVLDLAGRFFAALYVATELAVLVTRFLRSH